MNRRLICLLLMAVMVLTLVACKKEEEPTVTTFPDVPGVALVPDSFWDETEPVNDPALPTIVHKGETEETAAAVEDKAENNAPGKEETGENNESQGKNDNTEETQKPTEKPTDTVINMTQYEWYHSLTGEQQMAYMESFDNMDAFFDWYNAAKEEHEREKPGIDIGDGNIDLGEIIGGNG